MHTKDSIRQSALKTQKKSNRIDIFCNNYIQAMEPREVACNTIRDKFRSGFWKPGDRLPSLGHMAQLCGVSRSTMWRALKILQKEGLLSAKQRGSITAGPPGIAGLTHVVQGKIWERLKSRIGHDILAGTFGEGPIPLINKLAAHYHVSVITLKKALDHLVAEGLLDLRGHRYVQVSGRFRGNASALVFISWGDTERNILSYDERTQRIAAAFERECQIQGYRSVPLGFYDHTSQGNLWIRRDIAAIKDVAGFVINLWMPWDPDYMKQWFDLIAFLLSREVPIVIVDQAGNLVLPKPLLRPNRIRILKIASRRAGAMMADYLLLKGHSRIAYVAPSFGHAWARDRYAGLVAHVEQYGQRGAGVDLHSLSQIADLSELVLEFLELDKNEIVALFGGTYSATGIRVLISVADRIKRTRLLPAVPNDALARTIRSEAHHLATIAAQPHDAFAFGKLFDAMYGRASTYAWELYLGPFFETILISAACSAWVCSDDKTALQAMSFLTAQRKHVPGEIAVAGFDNWQGAFTAGLSSYEFDMDGMVKEAIALICQPKYCAGQPESREFDGYVVERRSSGWKHHVPGRRPLSGTFRSNGG